MKQIDGIKNIDYDQVLQSRFSTHQLKIDKMR